MYMRYRSEPPEMPVTMLNAAPEPVHMPMMLRENLPQISDMTMIKYLLMAAVVLLLLLLIKK